MDSLMAAVCQLPADGNPREAAVRAASAGAKLVVLPPLPPRPDRPVGVNGAAREALLAEAGEIAREAGCFLVPGTAVVPTGDGRGLGRVAWLLSPEGRLLGEQVQTHTTRDEESAGLVRSADVRVLDMDGVGIGLLVGLDAWVPEVGRILALEGALVLVAPLALTGPYAEAHQLAGVWQIVQQNQVFGLEACLISENGGGFAGRSAVTGPCEMTADETGFVVRAPSEDRALTLLGALDLAEREDLIGRYDIFGELNTGLYRRAFPDAYYRTRETRRTE